MTPSPSAPIETTRRRLALCLDVAATIGLIAGMGALLAVADIRTFDVSSTYLAAIVVTAPAAGLIYVAGRRASADPARSTPPAPSPPQTDRELRLRILKCLVDLMVFLCVLNMILLPGNLVLAANRWLDRSKPVDAAFVIDTKRLLHKDKRAFFAMPRADDPAAQDSVAVPSALYDRIVLNRTKVILPMHDGALGFAWTKHADLHWSDLAPPK